MDHQGTAAHRDPEAGDRPDDGDAIVAISRRRGRRPITQIRLDSGVVHDLHPDVVANAGLMVGDALSGARQAELLVASEQRRARETALRALAARPRSTRELRDLLHRKQFTSPAIDAVMTDLEREGVVDDRAFAHFWVENRQLHRPRGPRALRHELRRKGVDPEHIDAAIIPDHDQELEIALAIARQRLASLGPLPLDARRRRLAGFLERRGFSTSVIHAVLRSLVPPDGEDGSSLTDSEG